MNSLILSGQYGGHISQRAGRNQPYRNASRENLPSGREHKSSYNVDEGNFKEVRPLAPHTEAQQRSMGICTTSEKLKRRTAIVTAGGTEKTMCEATGGDREWLSMSFVSLVTCSLSVRLLLRVSGFLKRATGMCIQSASRYVHAVVPRMCVPLSSSSLACMVPTLLCSVPRPPVSLPRRYLTWRYSES